MSDIQEQIERARAESDIPAADAAEEPMQAEISVDRTRRFEHTGFSRMRTGWEGDDKDKVAELEYLAEELVKQHFAMAFAVREMIWRRVRTQAHDSNGELLTYPDGTPIWVKDELGVPEEDWGQIGDAERRRLLLAISSNMFEWELASAKLWTDAMYSKGIWEEAFAQGFTAIPPGVVSGRPTVDDRTQWGHKNAARERYFALFRSGMSRQADGILKAMRGLQAVLMNTAIW